MIKNVFIGTFSPTFLSFMADHRVPYQGKVNSAKVIFTQT